LTSRRDRRVDGSTMHFSAALFSRLRQSFIQAVEDKSLCAAPARLRAYVFRPISGGRRRGCGAALSGFRRPPRGRGARLTYLSPWFSSWVMCAVLPDVASAPLPPASLRISLHRPRRLPPLPVLPCSVRPVRLFLRRLRTPSPWSACLVTPPRSLRSARNSGTARFQRRGFRAQRASRRGHVLRPDFSPIRTRSPVLPLFFFSSAAIPVYPLDLVPTCPNILPSRLSRLSAYY